MVPFAPAQMCEGIQKLRLGCEVNKTRQEQHVMKEQTEEMNKSWFASARLKVSFSHAALRGTVSNAL